jgi:competence protein ComEC
MSKSRIFFYCCLFFIIGIFIGSVFELSFFIVYLILLAAVFFIVLKIKNQYFLILGILILCLFLGIIRFNLSLPANENTKIHYFNDQQIEFVGVVAKEPDTREDRVKYEIKVENILLDNVSTTVTGKVLVTNFLFPEYNYGDKLKLNCSLKTVEPIEDFAYDKYLARYNIYSLCYYPHIELLEAEQGSLILGSILKVKNHFVSRTNKILPEPQASFLAGLLIGAKKSIPGDLLEVFNITGTTHIIAVSGYNVTIIATFLMLLALNLSISRKKAFWLIIVLLIIFDIITGLQASIIRASIMGALVLLAAYLGRLSQMKNALVLTAVIMLLINPKILVFDLGFQLSFLATLGLIYFNPVLMGILKIKKLKNKFLKIVLGDYLITTLSAIILTTPLILYNFGKISLIAPFANILVLPVIPIAMLLGFIAGILSLILLSAGWVAGWSVWLVLTYIIWILEKLAMINWAYFEIPKISLGLMVVSYLIIISIIWKFKKYLK